MLHYGLEKRSVYHSDKSTRNKDMLTRQTDERRVSVATDLEEDRGGPTAGNPKSLANAKPRISERKTAKAYLDNIVVASA